MLEQDGDDVGLGTPTTGLEAPWDSFIPLVWLIEGSLIFRSLWYGLLKVPSLGSL